MKRCYEQRRITQQPDELARPVSSFVGPIAELIGQGMLSPPSRGYLPPWTASKFCVFWEVGGWVWYCWPAIRIRGGTSRSR